MRLNQEDRDLLITLREKVKNLHEEIDEAKHIQKAFNGEYRALTTVVTETKSIIRTHLSWHKDERLKLFAFISSISVIVGTVCALIARLIV